MSNIQTGAERMPHDLSHLGFLAGRIGRLITISTTPDIAGDSFEMEAVGALRLTTLRGGHAIDHAALLDTINADTNKIPKHLFQGYLNIYNNYFKAPWMPDRTEANPNELNQDDARYGFRCCHFKNFFFSSRRRHTRSDRDWSSDVCSSDLQRRPRLHDRRRPHEPADGQPG